MLVDEFPIYAHRGTPKKLEDAGMYQPTPSDILGYLVERYNEPHRYYHTLAHIDYGLKVYKELMAEPLPVLEFFAWAYHDAVYDSTQSDNEQRSADVFMRDALNWGFPMSSCDRVTELILATHPSAEPISVVNDIDLSILGAAPELYDTYVQQIRKEYSWVEPEVWRKGRTAVLKQLMHRSKLYITPEFEGAFTLPAIENISRELETLL